MRAAWPNVWGHAAFTTLSVCITKRVCLIKIAPDAPTVCSALLRAMVGLVREEAWGFSMLDAVRERLQWLRWRLAGGAPGPEGPPHPGGVSLDGVERHASAARMRTWFKRSMEHW